MLFRSERINWIVSELARSRGVQREMIRGTTNIWSSSHSLAQSMSLAFAPGGPIHSALLLAIQTTSSSSRVVMEQMSAEFENVHQNLQSFARQIQENRTDTSALSATVAKRTDHIRSALEALSTTVEGLDFPMGEEGTRPVRPPPFDPTLLYTKIDALNRKVSDLTAKAWTPTPDPRSRPASPTPVPSLKPALKPPLSDRIDKPSSAPSSSVILPLAAPRPTLLPLNRLPKSWKGDRRASIGRRS